MPTQAQPPPAELSGQVGELAAVQPTTRCGPGSSSPIFSTAGYRGDGERQQGPRPVASSRRKKRRGTETHTADLFRMRVAALSAGEERVPILGGGYVERSRRDASIGRPLLLAEVETRRRRPCLRRYDHHRGECSVSRSDGRAKWERVRNEGRPLGGKETSRVTRIVHHCVCRPLGRVRPGRRRARSIQRLAVSYLDRALLAYT